jgi:hypothetical protein
VAGTGDGKVAYSTDGTNWTVAGSSTFGGDAVRGIAYAPTLGTGSGRFVAVGLNCKVAYSDDGGVTWTAGTGIPTTDLQDNYAVVYASTGANKFVAVGKYGQIMYSPNGVSWTRDYAGAADAKHLYSIAYDGAEAVFIAGGEQGRLIYSDNGGLGWEWLTDYLFDSNAKYDLTSIIYAGGKFIAAGGNGNMKTANKFSDWADYGDKWYAWSGVDSQFGATGILGLAYGRGTFIAVGHNGKMSLSVDGANWTAVPQDADPAVLGDNMFSQKEYIRAITYGNKFVIGGNAYSSYSDQTGLPTTGKFAYSD